MKTSSSLIVAATIIAVLSICVLAQDVHLTFEVASIKSNKPSDTSFPGGWCHGVDTKPDTGGGLGAVADLVFSQPALGRCGFNQLTLKHLVGIAYGVEFLERDQRILGGPGWIASDKYRIDTVAPNPSAVAEATERYASKHACRSFQAQDPQRNPGTLRICIAACEEWPEA